MSVVTGCADPILTDDQWLERDAKSALIGCKGSSRTHKWQCLDTGQWSRSAMNCSVELG